MNKIGVVFVAVPSPPLTFSGYSWTTQNVISPRAGAMPLVSISHSITWIWTSRYGISYILILACAVEVFVG
jgi:hypothetical protein